MVCLLSQEISSPQLMQTLKKWKDQVILKHGQKPGQRKTKHQNRIREEEAWEDQNTQERSPLALSSSNGGALPSSSQVWAPTKCGLLGNTDLGPLHFSFIFLRFTWWPKSPKCKNTTMRGLPRYTKKENIVEN